MSLNHVAITGNLTRDPELRTTNASGVPVANITVAVNDRIRNQQTGEWESRPNFIDCVIFGNRATAMANMLYKGFKVAITGKLRQQTWESNGQRRSKVEIVVDDIDLMSARDAAGPGAYQANTRPAPNQGQGYGQTAGYRQGQGY